MQDTIAIIFDFDDTLAPDTTSAFLQTLGIDVRRFWSETVGKRIDDGWDPIPAYLYEIIQISRGEMNKQITEEMLCRFGRTVEPYSRATRICERLRKHAASVNPNVSVEFYVISSGMGTILRATRVAKHFKHIWACEFHYADDGVIDFPCNVVSFTDKTRYIFHVSKGIFGDRYVGKPFEVN
jgi:hypothetical protein